MSPKCVKCEKFFHPDWSVVVDEDTNACKCVFCYTNKKEVTVEGEDGAAPYTVSKREAEENYRRYIKDLKDSDKVKKVLMKGQENPFKP